MNTVKVTGLKQYRRHWMVRFVYQGNTYMTKVQQHGETALEPHDIQNAILEYLEGNKKVPSERENVHDLVGQSFEI